MTLAASFAFNIHPGQILSGRYPVSITLKRTIPATEVVKIQECRWFVRDNAVASWSHGYLGLDGDYTDGIDPLGDQRAFVPLQWSGPYDVTGVAGYSLDTTKLRNGPHQLGSCIFNAPLLPPDFSYFGGCGTVSFVVQNTLRMIGLVLNLGELRLLPNERSTVLARTQWNDGRTIIVPANVTRFTADTSGVFSVDRSGIVRALKVGIGSLSVRHMGMEALCRIVVGNDKLLRHLSRRGKVITTYDSTQSVMPRSMFQLNTGWLQQAPGLLTATKQASINAAEGGIYRYYDYDNPENVNNANDHFQDSQLEYCRDNGLMLVPTGDGYTRHNYLPHFFDANGQPNEEGKWRIPTLTRAITRAGETDLVPYSPMFDEARGEVTPPFRSMSETVRQAKDSQAQSWSVVGNADNEDVRQWNALDDIFGFYWFKGVQHWSPYASGLKTDRREFDDLFLSRLSVLPVSYPMTALIQGGGVYYSKLTASTFPDYRPGVDVLRSAGNSAKSVLCQIWSAAARGATAWRVYTYDAGSREQRILATPGAGCQTGLDPVQDGPDRWEAIGLAFKLIEDLKADLLQPFANVPDLGTTIVAGARSGRRSNVLIAVNWSEVPVQGVFVDLTTLWTGRPAKQYRLIQGMPRQEATFNRQQFTDVFLAGEVRVIVCPRPPSQ